jgi:S-formylglutathione hydrolase
MHGTWATIELAGHRVELYDPPEAPRGRAVIYLHPYGLELLRGREPFTRVLDEVRLPCACPLTQHSWWADRICAEFDPKISAEQFVLNQVVPLVVERWGVTLSRIGLLGISMGGQGALRLAFRHARRFPAVAAISAAIDLHQWHQPGETLFDMFESKEHCRQDSAVLHIDATDYPPAIFFCCDPADALCFRGNDRLHEKLAALAIPHKCDLTTQAGGHSWEYFNTMAEPVIRFLDAALAGTTRRLM